MLSIEQISARVANLRERASERDSRQQDVLAVRQGHIASVYPDFFPEGVDANVVANFIDMLRETFPRLWRLCRQSTVRQQIRLMTALVSLLMPVLALLLIILLIRTYRSRCIQGPMYT